MLAIIIPYYKIDFFKETLLSLEQQTCKDFNIYIGNDASPNNPKQLIEDCLKSVNYKYFKYSENLGGKNLALQWERVIAESGNEPWFMILGDDDKISHNFVEEFYKNLPEIEKAQSNVVKFSQCWIDENGAQIRNFTNYPKLIDPIENLEYKFLKGHPSSLSEHVFRKTKYLKYHFQKFPLAWHSDDYAVLQWSEDKPLSFTNEAKAYIRVSNKSISGSENGTKEKSLASYQFFGLLLKNYYRKLPKDFVLRKIQDQIDFAYRNKKKININLIKIYYNVDEYKKLLKVPIVLYYLRCRHI